VDGVALQQQVECSCDGQQTEDGEEGDLHREEGCPLLLIVNGLLPHP
jgi:hypothetical protein